MQESLVKYLAGLCDSDGCLSFSFAPAWKSEDRYCFLRMTIVQTEFADKGGAFMRSLPELTGLGSFISYESKNENHSIRNEWRVGSVSDVEKLLPRLIKHMVIKARHWQWMLETYRNLRSKTLTPDDCAELKARSKESRLNTGPIKPRNYPSWAWTCGFLEGDGGFRNRYYKKTGRQEINVRVEIGKSDKCAIDLLYKSFGGLVYEKERTIVWRRSLGAKNASFAKHFLSKLLRFSHIKRHQMEKILAYHRQRLNESTP
jgi:hypothetical protein